MPRRKTPPAICRHCQKTKVSRPRGLCWHCYYSPGVKELYPSTSKYARRGVGNGQNMNPPLPAEPCLHLPGTPERQAEIERRAAAGEQLHHPRDAENRGYTTPEEA